MHEKPAFTRRPDSVHHGRLVSFCNQCFQTVATSYWEVELDREENKHICDLREREYWKSALDAAMRKEPKSEPIPVPAIQSNT